MNRYCVAVCWLLGVTFLSHSPLQAATQKTEPPQLVVQSGHFAVSAAFSPDGKTVISGGMDYSLKLWDIATGRELRTFAGHRGPVSSVAFSPNGKLVASGGGEFLFSNTDQSIKIWDVATGTLIHTLAGHGGNVNAIAFSPDNARLVSCGESKSGLFSEINDTIKLWDIATGKEVRTFSKQKNTIKSIAFSPDGKFVASSGGVFDGKITIWNVTTGEAASVLAGHTDTVQNIAFSPDGSALASGSHDKTIKLWSATTGKVLHTLVGHSDHVTSLAFSPDGKTVLSGSEDKTLRIWDVVSGRELKTLLINDYRVQSLGVSIDGKSIVSTGGASDIINGWTGSVQILDIDSGKILHSFTGHGSPIASFGLSPDGKSLALTTWERKDVSTLKLFDIATGQAPRILNGSKRVIFSPEGKTLATAEGEHFKLLDVTTGQLVMMLEGCGKEEFGLAFSPDSKSVASGNTEKAIKLCDTGSGRVLHTFPGDQTLVSSLAFSPDGKKLASGHAGGTLKIVDVITGKEVLTLTEDENRVRSLAFSPDGTLIIAAGTNDLKLWDAVSGQKLRTLSGHEQKVYSVAFSPDGKTIASGGEDHTLRLWETNSGRELHKLKGHTADIGHIAFTVDGKIIVSSSFDRTIKLWRVSDGALLATLTTFTDGHWAITDPEGRFDASNGGNNPHLHWVFENTPIDLSQLKDRYYDPGLLQKIMGYGKEPLRTVPKFEDALLHKWPEVAVSADPQNPLHLSIRLTDRGDGYGRVRVRLNGKELTANAAAGKTLSGKSTSLSLDLDPERLLPGDNRVDVVAWPGVGHIPSPAAQLIVSGAATRGAIRSGSNKVSAIDINTATEPATLHAVVMGVSQYAGASLRLAFSGKDANDFAAALELGGARLFGAERVRLHRFSDYAAAEGTTLPAERLPSRDNLRRAFDTIAKEAKAGDILLVYLAGHGVMTPGAAGEAEYYYLSREAQSTDLSDLAVRKLWGISSTELTDWIKQIKASKQVLVLDTCAAGGAIEKLVAKRQIPGAQVIALEQLKDRTGVHILAGAAADRVSYEATQFGQGLLTYALLTGMKGAALKDEIVDVQRLFQYTRDEVPKLARQIGGIQEPRLSSPQGESFAIGRMAEDDRKKVPLAQIKPMIQRASFQDEARMMDVLKLGKRFDDRLKQETYAAARGKLVYVDADDFPEAWQLSGRYRKSNDAVHVMARLFQGDTEKGSFEVLLPLDEAAQIEALLAATMKAMEK